MVLFTISACLLSLLGGLKSEKLWLFFQRDHPQRENQTKFETTNQNCCFLHHVSVDLSSFWNLQPRSSVIVKAPWKETVHNKVHQNSPHGIWLLVSDSPLFRTQVVMIHLVSFRKKKNRLGRHHQFLPISSTDLCLLGNVLEISGYDVGRKLHFF